MKYLKLYKKWLGKTLPGNSGICKALKTMSKNGYTPDDLYSQHFRSNETSMLWFESKNGHFNETRQNMILLLAAINGEL